MAEAPEPGAELLLFRLAGRGYACRRAAVREVVDVGTGQPHVPGLPPSSLAALGGGERPVAVVSLRLALGLPDIGPVGRIIVVTTRLGPVGFLVDEVLRVDRLDPDARVLPSRFGGGYIAGTVLIAGESWLLVEWDAIRVPRRGGTGAPPPGDPGHPGPADGGMVDMNAEAVNGPGVPPPRADR